MKENKKFNKFNVGDLVKVDNLTGTVICISFGDLLGVEFDDDRYSGHRCLGVKLKAGSPSNKCNCWWVNPDNAKRIKPVKTPSRLIDANELMRYVGARLGFTITKTELLHAIEMQPTVDAVRGVDNGN